MARKKTKLEVVGEVVAIPVTKVLTGSNDRTFFDENGLLELAASIAKEGLLQPITVRPVEVEGEKFYDLVAGERRFRAVQKLKWIEINAHVREMSEESALAAMLMENTGRRDLLPMEEAYAYQRRIDKFGWTVEKIADVAGVSVDRVKKRIRLSNLVEEIHPLVNSGDLPLGHAEALATLDPDKQRAAVRVYSSGSGVTLRDFQTIVQQMNAAEEASLFDLEQFFVSELEKGSAALRGKAAQVNVPTSSALPKPTVTGKDSTGDVIFRYIQDLLAEGKDSEAAAVGNVFDVLVKSNFVKLPSSLRA